LRKGALREKIMPRKDEVRKEDFLIDLRAGLNEQELMYKYKLTPRGMGTLFRNLVNARIVTLTELLSRCTRQLNLPEVAAELRIRSRKQLEFLLPIGEVDNPENTGFIFDVSEDGLGTRGLKAKVGQTMTFDIPADEYLCTQPIRFQGICRWVEEKGDRWASGAGFGVVHVLQGSFSELEEIIRGLNPDVDVE
jgi:hypothetical protein